MPKIQRLLAALVLVGSYTIASGRHAQAQIPGQNPNQGPINKPGNTLAEDILMATAHACAAANVDRTLPQNIVAQDVTSTRAALGVVDLKWTPGAGADSSVRFTVQTLMLGSDSWSDWTASSLPYNASSFTASGLPLFHQLKFGISAVKTTTANLPTQSGQLKPMPVKCPSDTVYSNVVTPTKSAFQLGVLPATPIPSIPAGDDIILYVHGGPGSRLEEASDLVAPLQREGLAVGTHYTIISFDQISQGYSSMIDPDSLVPQHQNNTDYYPLVQFSESTIGAFVDALHRITPVEDRNIFVIGGSTGGALALRMGQSLEAPWVKKIVAWNPASVWTTYSNDVRKGLALATGFSRATATEDPGRREEYFNFVFGMPTNTTQPNPEEWYRGDRDQYSIQWGTQKPFRAEWPCKWDYIGAARLEHQEIYHPAGRRWHWRLGTEILDFSFFNDSWLGPAKTAPDQGGNPANYLDIVKPTLLVASDDDDWNEGDFFGNPLPWENRWARVRVMAPMMNKTPGSTLYVPNTGHSIHNERPNFFANQIVGFLSGPKPTAMVSLAGLDEFDETKMGWDSCKPQLSQFVAPIPQLLDNPDSATFMMEPAQLEGRFSNNKTAGQYSLRLQGGLRDVAAAQDPTNALVHAAVSFYNGDIVVGNAFADLAVSGRTSYGAFQKHQTTRDEIVAGAKALKWGSNPHFAVDKPVLTPPIDEGKLSAAADAALTRAYQVAWALRNPDPLLAYWFRQTLGWIAVSAEDDPPDRPVNVPSGIPIFDQIGNQISAYPQYDLTITTCRAPDPTAAPSCLAANAVNTPPVTVSMQIRYTIASSDSAGPSRIPPVALAPHTPGASASADKADVAHLR